MAVGPVRPTGQEQGEFLDTILGRVHSDDGDSGYRDADGSVLYEPDPAPPRSRTRLAVVLLTVLALLVGGGFLGATLWVDRFTSGLDDKIERFGDPFADIPAVERPAVGPTIDAVNILLVGSDSRISAGDPTQWVAGSQRTDAIMLLHIPADRRHAFVMSIPRDSWVDIPGHGQNKVNAAFSFGGPSLMIRTIEQLTNVRVDHFVLVDFTGFVEITDALGGVDIQIPRATGWKKTQFQSGLQHMDGETALKYVRQRHDLPGGDFDRVKRQQNWTRAIARAILERGMLDNLNDSGPMDALAAAVSTDDGFTMDKIQELAGEMRGMSPKDMVFFTIPVQGTGRSPDGTQSVVLLDPEADRRLWEAVQSDRVDDWVERFSTDTLGDVVN